MTWIYFSTFADAAALASVILTVTVSLRLRDGGVSQVILTLRLNLSACDGALQVIVTSSTTLGPHDGAPRVIVILIYLEIQID
jgi:hypothetical protein